MTCSDAIGSVPVGVEIFEKQRMTFYIFLVAGVAMGFTLGVLLSQGSCSDNSWWNPLAAYRSAVSIAQNPLVSLFSPDASASAQATVAALTTSISGAAWFGVRKGLKSVGWEVPEEMGPGELGPSEEPRGGESQGDSNPRPPPRRR